MSRSLMGTANKVFLDYPPDVGHPSLFALSPWLSHKSRNEHGSEEKAKICHIAMVAGSH